MDVFQEKSPMSCQLKDESLCKCGRMTTVTVSGIERWSNLSVMSNKSGRIFYGNESGTAEHIALSLF